MFLSTTDLNDKSLDRFREAIYLELGEEPRLAQREYSFAECQQYFSQSPDDVVEELYKYGRKKWIQSGFEMVELFCFEDQVVSISGAKMYGDWLRVGMHHFTLSKFRKTYRGLLFRSGGFLERHISHARNMAAQGVFFTIYPHKKNLEYFVKNMKYKRFSPEQLEMSQLKDVKFGGGPLEFNGVQQYFFYIPFGREEFSVEEIIDLQKQRELA